MSLARTKHKKGNRWIILFGALALLALALAWWRLFADLPDPRNLFNAPSLETVKFHDRHGRILYEWIGSQPGNHTYIPLEQVPLALQQATLATEDATFYTNPGVDLWAIARALYLNLRYGEIVSGGSTITQQVARLLLLSPEERYERTGVRKLREAYLAWRIHHLYSKDQVLELYLNHAYYGDMCYGVQAAANGYFGVPARDLDLAQCAMLAGLPQAPALYNPLLDLEAARARQAIVLNLMIKAGYIDQEQARLASEELLRFASTPFSIQAPHFVMYVLQQLERTYGWETLATSGWQVTTTLDLDMQQRAEAIMRRHLAQLGDVERKGIDHQANNAALVALDPTTGQVLAMVGSPNYFDATISGAVNACQSLRQPGSSLKPITYAAALAADYTPATVLYDVPTTYYTREGDPYMPLNYDRQFHGPMSLRQALATSSNVAAVSVLDHIGIPALLNTAQKMGIQWQGDLARFGLALTLGGGEVRLLDLTSAYSVFARGGSRLDPVSIQRITDAAGKTIHQAATPIPEPVLDPRVAYLITHILSDDQARSPAFGTHSALYLGRPAAVKTGTNTDWRDNWTIGYTPDLVAGVWVGNADNTPMIQVSSITGAAPIWHAFMTEMLKNQPKSAFAIPTGLKEVQVCAVSGQLPNEHCPHQRLEIFVTGTEPSETCHMHQAYILDAATGLLATASTPPERRMQRVFLALPAIAQGWAQEQGIAQPPTDVDTTHAGTPQLTIVSPPTNSRYVLTTELPSANQALPIVVRWAGPGQPEQVTILLDGEPVAVFAQPPYRYFWPLRVGSHLVQAHATIRGQSISSATVEIVVEPPRR